jgi:multicomponent Na+:H+ antiporter subunit G
VNLVVDTLSWVLLAAGGFFCIVGAVGLLRMPDFYTRMHAASVIETLGAGLILLGLMLQAGPTLVAVKLAMVGLLIFFVSPTATHALARAALARGLQPLLHDPGSHDPGSHDPGSHDPGSHDPGLHDPAPRDPPAPGTSRHDPESPPSKP